MTDVPTPPDLKAHLVAADEIVDVLPWKLGDTEMQRKRARGRVAALAHQVASLLASGWDTDDLRAVLASAAAADAPDPAAQEKRWRSALKQARHARRQAERPLWRASPPTDS